MRRPEQGFKNESAGPIVITERLRDGISMGAVQERFARVEEGEKRKTKAVEHLWQCAECSMQFDTGASTTFKELGARSS